MKKILLWLALFLALPASAQEGIWEDSFPIGALGGGGATILSSGSDADSSTLQSDSGLELVGGFLTLLRGCLDNDILKWDETEDDWNCEADAGAAGGDSISINSVAVVDPDFVSTGQISFTDTSNTVTADIKAAAIVQSDIDDTTTLAADPAYAASNVFFATTGLIWEGLTPDTNEGLLTAADVTADQTWTLPNETGTILTSVSTSGAFTSITGNTQTLGSGTFTTLTFDAGASDPVITASSGALNVSAGTFSVGGSEVVVDTDIGSTVQAYDADLATIAGLTATSGNVMFAAGSAWTSDATPAINCADCTGITTTGIANGTITYADIDATGTLAGNPAYGALSVWPGANGLLFEGTTNDAFEGLISGGDPTADRTWTLPNYSGIVMVPAVECSTSQMIVGGGTGVAPVCTATTGTGAPVRASGPTLVAPLLGTPASGVMTNVTGLPSSGILDGTIAYVDINNSATLAGNPAFGNNSVWIGANGLVWEGSTSDGFEGLLSAGDPTADRTWTLPNETGTILTSASTSAAITALTGSTLTLGSGAFTTLTFDAGASDPVITASSGALNVSTGTFSVGGNAVLTSASTSAALTAITGNTLTLGTGTFTTLTVDAGATDPVITFGSGTVTLTAADWDFGGAGIEIENGTAVPGSCTVGQLFMDTDATSGQQLYGCESGTFVQQGGAGSGDVTDVGPACSGGACLTDNVTTTGTTLLVWEGTTSDTNQVTIAMSSTDPAAAYTITFPDESGTLLTNASTTSALVSFGSNPTFDGIVTFPIAADPTTSADAQMSFDTDGWGTGYDALEIFNGTASAYVVATTASDVPTNGQVPKWNTGGTITWEDDSTGAGSLGSNLSSSTNDILSNTGTVVLGGTGNTNNEALSLDFETTANVVGVSSSTAAALISFGSISLATGADPADAGAIRLANNTLVAWEGTAEVSVSSSASDALTVTNSSTGIEMATTTATECVILNAQGALVPASGGAANSQIDDTNFSYFALEYDDTSDEKAYWNTVLPTNLASATMNVKIYWTAAACTATTADDVCFLVNAAGFADDEVYDGGSLGTDKGFQDVCSAANDLMITDGGSYSTGGAAGDQFVFQLIRDADLADADCTGDNNDISGDVRVMSVQLCYEVNNVFSGE